MTPLGHVFWRCKMYSNSRGAHLNLTRSCARGGRVASASGKTGVLRYQPERGRITRPFPSKFNATAHLRATRSPSPGNQEFTSQGSPQTSRSIVHPKSSDFQWAWKYLGGRARIMANLWTRLTSRTNRTPGVSGFTMAPGRGSFGRTNPSNGSLRTDISAQSEKLATRL